MTRLVPLPLVSLLALAAASAAQAAEPPITPGCWQSTNQVVSPFHSTSTSTRYISAGDVDRFLTGPVNHHYTCNYPTRHVAQGRLLMRGECVDNKGRKVEVDSSGTYTPTSFQVEAHIATSLLGLPISGRATTEGRRVGDTCPETAAKTDDDTARQ